MNTTDRAKRRRRRTPRSADHPTMMDLTGLLRESPKPWAAEREIGER